MLLSVLQNGRKLATSATAQGCAWLPGVGNDVRVPLRPHSQLQTDVSHRNLLGTEAYTHCKNQYKLAFMVCKCLNPIVCLPCYFSVLRHAQECPAGRRHLVEGRQVLHQQRQTSASDVTRKQPQGQQASRSVSPFTPQIFVRLFSNVIHFTELVMSGIGFHHAGLDVNDRKTIELMFSQGELPVLSRPSSHYVSFLQSSTAHAFFICFQWRQARSPWASTCQRTSSSSSPPSITSWAPTKSTPSRKSCR